MRNAFITTLEEKTSRNPDIMLLTGDLGFTVFENFSNKFPRNFLNMGVAEANMMGVASGLSLSGKIPFVYSIAPFVTLRPVEQIRNDVCLHKANVKIVGVGAGLAISHAGPTHHINEDIGVLRTFPDLFIISPSDPVEVKYAVYEALKYKGPVYIRLGKRGEPIIHDTKKTLKIRKAITIKGGNQVLILSHGSIIKSSLDAAKQLEQKGYSTAVVSVPTIKPIDSSFINNAITSFKYIFTVEEHNIIGGLGSAVSEIIAESNKCVVFQRIGVADQFCHVIGDHKFMKDYYGLSPNKIYEQIMDIINKSS